MEIFVKLVGSFSLLVFSLVIILGLIKGVKDLYYETRKYRIEIKILKRKYKNLKNGDK